jgi:uncharacterized protein YbjT (DUF2867 family)
VRRGEGRAAVTRVLVTGATGFVGPAVVRALLRDGHAVTAFVRGTSDRARLPAGVAFVPGDLDRPETLREALAGQGALVNVASLGFGHAPGIASAAKAAGIARSVFLGTTAVRTALDVPTKAVRLEAERVVLGAGVGATLLRPTMVYGAPGDRNLERLIRAVRRWPVVPIPGTGKGLQQPVHRDDVADAVAAVLPRAGLAGRTFDVPGPAPLTLSDLVRTVARVLGKRRLLVRVPRLLGRLVATREQLLRIEEDKSADPRPATEAFGFAPRPIDRGLREECTALGLPVGTAS